MTGTLPDLSLELEAASSGHARIVGVDEVGRGPWSGPVVAAAVILNPDNIPFGLNDSKKLTAARRESLMAEISASATVGIGEATVAEIDEINILQASFLAMRRALDNLTTPPDFVLVDGRHIPPGLTCPAQAVIKGDGRSLSIAAASIVAKVTRDRIMVALSQQFPGYAWETNMGYGTKAHVEGLNLHGVTQHHRRSFKPIHNMLRKAKSLSA